MPARTRTLLFSSLLAAASAVAGGGLTLVVCLWSQEKPPEDVTDAWNRGFRFGYETGRHDAAADERTKNHPRPAGYFQIVR